MDYQYLELTVKDHIATVSLNRPEKLNAINTQFAKEITMMFQAIDIDNDIWMVILKSNARIFCAGLDLLELDLVGRTGADALLKLPMTDRFLFDNCYAIDNCHKPVICLVHGKCVGFGLDIAACCDMVFCTEDAEFSLREPRVGITADVGALQRLPHIIGIANTKRMAFTGAFFSAEQMEKMGLVMGICPDEDAMMGEALKLISEIKKSAPLAVQASKELINYNRDASIREGVNLAIHKNMLLITSEDCKEAYAAFMEKRAPEFKAK